jgi:hypothetical protein
MKVDYLLSFKDNEEVQNLSEDFIKLISNFISKNFLKKSKKKVIKSILKCNLLKNNNLQTSKNKIENKTKLILNKISNDNFEQIVGEFLSTFLEMSQNDYNSVLQTIYIKMLKDEKFITLFYKFYLIINNIYNSLYSLSNQIFIDLVELKTNIDYSNFTITDESPTHSLLLQDLNKEEHRINNLNIILLLIKSDNLNTNIISHISSLLVNTSNIPDIYYWFSNEIVNKIDSIQNYHSILKNKLSSDINNRYSILLKNLLESNNMSFDDLASLDNQNNKIILDDQSDVDENICNIDINEDKTEFEIEVDNLIEEFLLLEDFNEVKMYIETLNHKDNTLNVFTVSLLNIYFNNNLNNYGKFKNLFINLKKSKLIKTDIFKTSLKNLLNGDDRFDYLNLDNKIDKIIEIYKIVQIKLTKEYIENIASFKN